MLNPGDHIWKLITGKLAGQLRPDQEVELKVWLETKPEHANFFQEVVQLWEHSPNPKIDESATFSAWEKLNSKLENRSSINPIPTTTDTSGSRNVKWLIAASFLAVAMVMGAYLFSYLSPNQFSKTPTYPGDSTSTSSALTYRAAMDFIISQDSLDFMRLPDGTKVWLNKGTELSYTKNYNRIIREVHLKGEAYFEVQKDSLRPFIIKAGDSHTRVLGTSFNLRAYQKQSPRLTVVSGKVTFTNEDSEQILVLSPGETGILDSEEGKLIKKLNGDPHFLDWKHTLVYRQEISHPEDFLSEKFHKKKNAINQTEIDGIIYNHASLATYKNIRLRVQYYHKKKEKMKSHVFTVYKPVGPGEAIDYQYRLADWFSQTDQLQIKVVDATVAKN